MRARDKSHRLLHFERLERRQLLTADLVVSEFMASNDATLADGDGNSSDWIEVYNPTSETVDLAGWHLTDNADNLDKWTFPNLPQSVLASGEYLVVFASGQADEDYVDPAGNLHTDFKVSAGGEYLALTRPDESIAHEYAPTFPPQVTDVSYGLDFASTPTSMIGPSAPIEVLVPMDDSLGQQWIAPGFVPDGLWTTGGVTGVGYDEHGDYDGLIGTDVESQMRGTNTSALIRAPFVLSDTSAIDALILRMRYDDGFVAYLNGQEVARRNAPLGPATLDYTVGLDVWLDGQDIHGTGDNNAGLGDGDDVATWVNKGTTGVGSATTGLHGGTPTYAPSAVPGGLHALAFLADNQTYQLPEFMDSDTFSMFVVAFNDSNTGSGPESVFWDYGTDGAELTTFNANAPGSTGQARDADNDTLVAAAGVLFDDQWGIGMNILSQSTGLFNLESGMVGSTATASNPDYASTTWEGTFRAPHIGGFPDGNPAMSFGGYIAEILIYDHAVEGTDRDTVIDYLTLKYSGQSADLAWDSKATAAHPDAQAIVFEEIDISADAGLLQVGANVLAIHGLNVSLGSSDFLIVPELTAYSAEFQLGSERYFSQPTPGELNRDGITGLGPIITDVTQITGDIDDGEDPVINATVLETFDPVDTVTLHYRVMYNPEITVAMLDNGIGPDLTAGDGIYTAVVPHAVASPGDMIRWLVTATDTQGVLTRAPTFADPQQSPEYYGTVTADPSVTSSLPILQWFTANPSAARTRSGTRASVFYNGEFYDNVFVRLRGKSSNAFTSKKSLKFDFNPGYRFRFDPALPRVDEINLNNTLFDKAYVRQTLSWETFAAADSPYSTSFPMRLQLNGDFYSVQIFVEQVDEDYLERNGLDPNGALYKGLQAGNNLQSGSVANLDKQTRLGEDFSDVQALVDGINPSNPQSERTEYIYDNVNIPGMINYLAVMSIIHGNDHHAKNYYLYRDTEGTREWMFLPWDLDLSLGKNFASLTDSIFADESPGGHPFWGRSDYPRASGVDHWNGFIDAVLDTPVIREMYLRRLRTLMDNILQAPETPLNQLQYESRLDELYDATWQDVLLDDAAWNDDWGTDYTHQQNIDRIVDLYLAPRRVFLFQTHSIDNLPGPGDPDPYEVAGIPHAQIGNPQINFGTIEFDPASGNQNEEYIELLNPNVFAVDVSGWKLTGGITHTFQPGTVIPANETLYVSPDVVAFRARTTGPSGGQERFVQDGYSGHLSDFGETISLLGADGVQVATTSYVGEPSDLQLYLRISEVNYNPYDAMTSFGDATVDNDQFEFIELVNSSGTETLNLEDAFFGSGIQFTFSSGTTLVPGQRILVVRDQASFESRYGTGLNIAGEFAGQTGLNNSGERLKLEDATGSTILDFNFIDSGKWPGRADGKGATLEPIDFGPEIDADSLYDNPENWRSSNEFHGTPGFAGAVPVFDVIVNEVLSHSDGTSLDRIELFNTTSAPIDLTGWHLSETSSDYFRYTFGAGVTINAGQYLVLNESQLGFALDGQYGDDIWLMEGDPNDSGRLLRFADHHDFDGTDTNVSLGRVPNGDPTAQGASLFPMARQTFAAANGSHAVGDVVISEVMYQPAPVPPAEVGNINQDELEYVELTNNTSSVLDVGGWMLNLTGGEDLVLPSARTIPAGASLLLVRFDPVLEPSKAIAFRNAYSLGPREPLVGPYGGKLDNDGETVELLRPKELGNPSTGFVLVDRVAYDESAPWPTTASGSGDSLHRTAPAHFGNFATSWTASTPTPGSVAFVSSAPSDFDADGDVDGDDFLIWQASFGIDNGGDADGDGDTDGDDFLIWQSQFGSGAQAGAGSATATPTNNNRSSLTWNTHNRTTTDALVAAEMVTHPERFARPIRNVVISLPAAVNGNARNTHPQVALTARDRAFSEEPIFHRTPTDLPTRIATDKIIRSQRRLTKLDEDRPAEELVPQLTFELGESATDDFDYL